MRITLKQMYDCYEKEDLAEIAKMHGLAGFQDLSKERLVEYVRSRVLDPAVMRSFFLYMTEDEINSLRAAAVSKDRAADASMDFTYAGAGGYVGFQSSGVVVLPDDVAAAFKKVDGKEFERERETKRRCLSYMNAAALIYGVCHIQAVEALYERNEGSKPAREEFLLMERDVPALRKTFALQGDFLMLPELAEGEYYRDLLEQQEDVAYYMPDRAFVEFAGENGFLPFQEEDEKLHAILMRLPGQQMGEAYGLCRELKDHLRCGEKPDEILQLLEENGFHMDADTRADLCEVLTAAIPNTRMLRLRGFTPAEIGEAKGKQNAKVVSLAERRRIRIAPGDPCPCGSGKRYRDCCGRKDTQN